MLHGLLLLGLLAARTDSVADGLSIWPKPSHAVATPIAAGAIRFTNVTFAIATDSSDGVLRKAAARYRDIILAQSADLGVEAVPGRGQSCKVTLVVENGSVPLSPGDMNESYELEASAAGCMITAHSVWGALRGLETLAQLVKPLGTDFQLDVPTVITDAP